MNDDTRRAPRRTLTQPVAVIDTLAEGVMGTLANVSETGMLMLCSVPTQPDALYQLRFSIPGAMGQPMPLDVGVHLLWREKSHAPDQSWTGFRFVTISQEQKVQLRAWIAEESSAV